MNIKQLRTYILYLSIFQFMSDTDNFIYHYFLYNDIQHKTDRRNPSFKFQT